MYNKHAVIQFGTTDNNNNNNNNNNINTFDIMIILIYN